MDSKRVYVFSSFIVKFYQNVFEVEFIKASEHLYSNEGQQLIQALEIPEYLRHVEKRFSEEYNRLLYYLNISTK